MALTLVDSHCHLPLLTEGKPPGTLEAIIRTAEDNGVRHMLCASVDLDSFEDISYISRKYNAIYASVGVHPNSKPGMEPSVEDLLHLARRPEVIAVGETGLDYYRSEGDLNWQRLRFRSHIRCARAAGKPLIIHMREARADTLRILAEEKAFEVGGVMHCFTDDYETAARAMDNNFLISFSGIVTFRNATALQEVARRVPLERMLVETDAPYLAPIPYRGKENQPAYVRHVASFIADLRGVSLEALAEQTTNNFFRTFPAASQI